MQTKTAKTNNLIIYIFITLLFKLVPNKNRIILHSNIKGQCINNVQSFQIYNYNNNNANLLKCYIDWLTEDKLGLKGLYDFTPRSGL